MDLTNQLLELVRDSLHYFRFIICLLIVIGFLKTALTLWLNYKIKKLEHKSTYQVIFDGNHHRAINLTTSDRIEFEKLEKHLLNNQMLLSEKSNEDKKTAA